MLTTRQCSAAILSARCRQTLGLRGAHPHAHICSAAHVGEAGRLAAAVERTLRQP